MEVDAHQSAVVESGKREGAGRRDASTERERVEGRILTIVSRQVGCVLCCVCALLCVLAVCNLSLNRASVIEPQ